MQTQTRTPTHFSREEVDVALHQAGRGAGRELFYRCIFHEDKHPSLAVNLEKQVFRCFGCQKSGHLSELFPRSSATPHKIGNGRGTKEPPTINYFHLGLDFAPPPTSPGPLPLLTDLDPPEWDGNLHYHSQKLLGDKHDRLNDCGTFHKADKCSDCGDNPASTWFCGTRLCTSCRRRRYAAFFEQRQWLGQHGGLNLIALPMHPSNIQEPVNMKGQIGLGRLALSDLQKELDIPWMVYFVQPRLHLNTSAPVFWILFPGPKLQLEHVKLTWVAYGHPLLPNTSAHYSNGHDAVWQLIEAASVPFAFSSDDDFLTCYQVTARMRSFESIGLKQARITGGMMKGKRSSPKTCPCCGGTRLKPLGRVPSCDVFWVDGVMLYLPDKEDPRRKSAKQAS